MMLVTQTQLPHTFAMMDVMTDSKIVRDPDGYYLIYGCGCIWKPRGVFGLSIDAYETVCLRHEVMAVAEREERVPSET